MIKCLRLSIWNLCLWKRYSKYINTPSYRPSKPLYSHCEHREHQQLSRYISIMFNIEIFHVMVLFYCLADLMFGISISSSCSNIRTHCYILLWILETYLRPQLFPLHFVEAPELFDRRWEMQTSFELSHLHDCSYTPPYYTELRVYGFFSFLLCLAFQKPQLDLLYIPLYPMSIHISLLFQDVRVDTCIRLVLR